MRYSILRAFPLSVTLGASALLRQGEEHEIPDDLVDGLKAEGFIGDALPPLENKVQQELDTGAVTAPPEITAPALGGDIPAVTIEELVADPSEVDAQHLENARAEYLDKFNKPADQRWNVDTINAKLIEA